MMKNIFCLLLILCLIPGCFSKDPRSKNLVPARGQIIVDGSPLVGANISFNAVPENEIVASAMARSDQYGKFSLTTFLPNDGIHPGTYKISVFAEKAIMPFPPEVMAEKEAKGEDIPLPTFENLIPKHYNNPETSDIVIEIPPKGKKDILIEVQSK